MPPRDYHFPIFTEMNYNYFQFWYVLSHLHVPVVFYLSGTKGVFDSGYLEASGSMKTFSLSPLQAGQ